MFPEWLIFVAILWLVFGGRRWGACGGGRHSRERMLEVGSRHGSRVRGRNRPEPLRTEATTLPPPSIEEGLRRDYVAGRLTVEEYETRLDELYRREAGGGSRGR